MSNVERALQAHLEEQRLRTEHRDSGLWDDTLLERYATQQDLVAFMDETHRATREGDVGYYGLSAVIFDANDLPEIRRKFEEIAGGTYWHSNEAVRKPHLRPRIAQMNEYIAEKSLRPAVIFDVRPHEIDETQERGARDICLGQALRYLNSEGIRDVVLDQFAPSEQHNVQLDQAVLSSLRASGTVDSAMWMHHARMGEEHALWSADTVAWSVQRHYFGRQDWDSQHLAPLSERLVEIHAQSGVQPPLNLASHAKLAGPNGRQQRTVPIRQLANRVEMLRGSAPTTGSRSAPEPRSMPKAPPAWGPEGPSRSL